MRIVSFFMERLVYMRSIALVNLGIHALNYVTSLVIFGLA